DLPRAEQKVRAVRHPAEYSRSPSRRHAMDSSLMPADVSSSFVCADRRIRGGRCFPASAAGSRRAFVALTATALVSLFAGCATMVDKSSMQATEGAPVSAQVELVRVPYDPSLPKYVVTIEPLKAGTEG